MTAYEFRGAVDHKVGSEIDRVLVDGCAEGVVGDRHGANSVGRGEQLLEVNHSQQRISGRLQVENITTLSNRREDRFFIHRVTQFTANSEAREDLPEM